VSRIEVYHIIAELSMPDGEALSGEYSIVAGGSFAARKDTP
jgi:hypothetical protein